MSRKAAVWIAAVAWLAPLAAAAQQGDPVTLRAMELANGVLKAQWMDFRVEQVELLRAGQPQRPSISKLHWQPAQWVSGDPRRAADGDRLTYLISRSDGPAGEALLDGDTAAIDRAMASWAAVPCMSNKVEIVERPDTGEDVGIFDSAFGYGGFGNWQAADIKIAGWMPPSFFETVTGPGGGQGVLAMSVTFVFVDPDGNPVDANRDGFLDTASSEIYFNDGFSWQSEGGFNLETVALHELGHSLGVGHVDPKHEAVMNPVYAGARTELTPKDGASVCPLWAAWLNW